MQPSGGENQRNFELPISPPEGENLANSAETLAVSTPEKQPQEQNLQASAQAASSIALPSQATTLDDASATPAADDNTGTVADTDRIEKEWVDRAKAIVQKTSDDPYEQNKAMSKIKAEYIKKRFNKTLKTDDAVAP